MDLTEFHTKLRIDLKDPAAVWSDGELTRSIERAVDDLSRHIPLERVYETTIDYTVTNESFTTPAAQDGSTIVNSWDVSESVAGATATLAANEHDVPRPCRVTVVDADNSITEFTIIIKGTDQDGYYVEESFFMSGGKIQTGKRYFYHITEVELNAITGNAADDMVEVGRSNGDLADYEVWMYLGNKPIKPGSETVNTTDAATTYTKDTDYEMDYINGRIRMKNGGSMSAGTEYYVGYTKSRLGVDVSDILHDAIRIVRIEYPVDKVPQQFPVFSIWDNFLYIGSKMTGTSQEQMSDKEHMAIYYEAPHKPPSAVSHGSYPRYLDQVVAIGAAAYALLIETLQYEQQAVTDMASARDSLGSCAAVHALATAALNSVTDYINEAHTQIGKMDTYLIDTAGGGTDNAKDVLANVTDDIAGLRTAISDALDAANAYLDEVDTTDLGKATVGAEALLETGDDKIDQLNDGKNVPELFAEYSRARSQIGITRIQAALGFIQEAAQRIANIRTYIDESGGWVAIANGIATDAGYRVTMGQTIVGQAQTYISQIDRYLSEATQYNESGGNCLLLSDRFRVEAQIRLAEFHEILKSKAEYRKRVSSVPVRQPA